jgi:hypothetical protein
MPVCLGIRPISGAQYHCQTVAGLLMWGALSDERTSLSFTTVLDLTRAVIVACVSSGSHDQILLSQIKDSLIMKGQVPVFISPGNRVVQLHPQELGSISVTSYVSRGYGAGIRTRLPRGY